METYLSAYLTERTSPQKEGTIIEIIVHIPKSPENLKKLKLLTAKIHSQYIAYSINQLSCPLEQKCQLIDAIVRQFRMESQEKEN